MGRPIGEDARDIIHKVYLYFASEAEKFKTDDGYFQKIQQRVATATGVSLKFIYLLLKDKGKQMTDSSATNYTLKRKFNDKDCDINVSNDDMPYFEPVSVDPEPIVIQQVEPEIQKVLQKPQKSMLERVLTAPNGSEAIIANKGRPTIVKIRPIATVQTNSNQKGPLILSNTQYPTGLIAIRPKPTVVQVHQPKMILNETQSNFGPKIIKVHSLAENPVPKQLQASVSTVASHKPRDSRPEFIKVYQIPRESVPKTVLATANKAVSRQNIKIQTVPIEFDPGSFINKVKSEPEDSQSD